MALEAKAAQALAGILVGQVEAALQVLSGGLLHVQLLCILLVKEANFLPKRRGGGQCGQSGACFLPDFYTSVPQPAYQTMVLSHFPVGLQEKASIRAGMREGGDTTAQFFFSFFNVF